MSFLGYISQTVIFGVYSHKTTKSSTRVSRYLTQKWSKKGHFWPIFGHFLAIFAIFWVIFGGLKLTPKMTQFSPIVRYPKPALKKSSFWAIF